MNRGARRFAFGLAVLLGGCSGRPPESPTSFSSELRPTRVWRAIDADPPRLTLNEAIRSRSVQSWALDAPLAPPSVAENSPIAEIGIDRPADEVQSVVATIGGLVEGTLSLWWRTSASDYAPEASMQLQMERAADASGRVIFDVGHHPAWSGRIASLRLYAEHRRRPLARPKALELRADELLDEPLRSIAERPWKVALDQDVRNGFLLLPGPGKQFEIDSDGGELRFSYGVEQGVRVPMELTVELESGTASRSTLWRQRLADGATRPTWSEATIALPTLHDRRARLRFTAHALGPYLSSQGFVLIANPEIFRERRGTAPANVILISIDTLRADHLSSYGYARATSPHLDRWAATHAVRFASAITQAPSTLPSHASLLTGQDSFRHGAQHDALSSDLHTLAEQLRQVGYTTVAVTGGGYMSPAFGFEQGFDVYRAWTWGHDRAKELPENLDWAMRWLEERPTEPYFLFFHTYEIHSPYRAREPHFRRWNPSDPAEPLIWVGGQREDPARAHRIVFEERFEYRGSDPAAPSEGAATTQAAIDRYDSAIAYVDQQLGRLLGAVAETGVGERTLIVVTSDHGESFGERGLAGHGNLDDSNLLVPLWIAAPRSSSAGTIVATPVRLIDVAPTLLDSALGVPFPGADGRSLLQLMAGTDSTPAPPAWSYAANSNHGISLRFPGRLEYWLDDAAFASIEPRDRLVDLRIRRGAQSAAVPAPSARAALREWVSQSLARESAGAHVTLRNDRAESIRLRIEADRLGSTRVKMVRGPEGLARWAAGAFELDLAGETVVLNLQVPFSSSLRFSGADSRGRELPALTIRAEILEQTRHCAPGGAWVEARPAGEALTISTRFVGARGTEAPDTRIEDGLQRELRALGYLQ